MVGLDVDFQGQTLAQIATASSQGDKGKSADWIFEGLPQERKRPGNKSCYQIIKRGWNHELVCESVNEIDLRIPLLLDLEAL